MKTATPFIIVNRIIGTKQKLNVYFETSDKTYFCNL